MPGIPGYTNGGFGLRNETDITNPLWITDNGFVGVRTTTPTSPFHVVGSTETDEHANGPDLAASAATATGTNWVGTSFSGAGYTHTTGSTVPLTSTIIPINGRIYRITATTTLRTAGSYTINLGVFHLQLLVLMEL